VRWKRSTSNQKGGNVTEIERAAIVRDAGVEDGKAIHLQPLLESLGWTCHVLPAPSPGICTHERELTAKTPIEAFGLEIDNYELHRYELLDQLA
jgi:hypothetical protein